MMGISIYQALCPTLVPYAPQKPLARVNFHTFQINKLRLMGLNNLIKVMQANW